MKTNRFHLLLTACGLVAAPVFSQEEIKPGAPPSGDKPTADTPGKPPPPPVTERREKEHRERYEEQRRDNHHGPQPEMKPASYIGVMTRGLGPELYAQTGLPEGFGLLVEEVMPDSPAQAAGLKQHDILVLLGDQRLVNQEQLSALIREQKKNAEVVFTVKRAGAEQKITVKIGEKMMPVAFNRRTSGPDGNGNWFGMFDGRDGERFGNQIRENAERFGREMRENGQRFGEQMRDFGERMKEWSRGPKDRPAPQAPQFNNRGGDERRDGMPPPKDGPRHDGDRRPGDGPQDQNQESKSFSSSNFQRNVTRRDDSGDYSLRDDNGAKVFTVKPKDGEEQSFIVNTEKQRQAIPEQFRAKLRELENVNPPTPPTAPGGPEKVRPRDGN